MAAALGLLRGSVHRYRELVLAAVFLYLAAYELFEILVLEAQRPSLSLAVLVHSLQVVVILAGTYLVLRVWQGKTESEEALGRLVEKVTFAREEERRRIAYELHDALSPLVVSAKQHLDTCQDLWDEHPARARRELHKGLDRLERAIVETRHVLMALRPSAVDAIGLARAARDLLHQMASEAGWSVTLSEEVGERRMPAPVEAAAFRILQEALTNALRHARTARVEVALRCLGSVLELEVRDHGIGLGLGDEEAHRGLGLQSMRERARLLGGTCDIERAHPHGTRVQARLPLAPPRATEHAA